MPYRIHAKTGGSAFFVVVETPEDALAKFAELAETYRAGVTARDLSGRLIDLASLQAEIDAGADMPTVLCTPDGFKAVDTIYGPDFRCGICNVPAAP